MSLAAKVMRRAEPAVIRYYQWRGDPLARWMRPQTKTDPSRCTPISAGIPCPQRARCLDDGRSRSGGEHPAGPAVQLLPRAPARLPAARLPGGNRRAELPAADLLTMYPPNHTRIQRLVSGAFTPKAISGLEPWIREVTGRLLAAANAAAGFDLIDALAFPFPSR